MTADRKKVAIILPHYQTEELVRLCLRSIRKYTSYPYEVIVVDNHSQDGSLDYLKSLKWITLIARGDETEPNGATAHQAALDIGLAATDAPYVLSIHSDTIVKTPDWLDRLVEMIEADDKIGAIGTWKLEMKSKLQIVLKELTDFRKILGRLRGRRSRKEFIRSHCALYRADLLKKFNVSFLGPETAGKTAHDALVSNGYEAKLIPVLEMMSVVDHLNHGTFVLTNTAGFKDWKLNRMQRKIQRYMDSPRVKEILADDSLDR